MDDYGNGNYPNIAVFQDENPHHGGAANLFTSLLGIGAIYVVGNK